MGLELAKAWVRVGVDSSAIIPGMNVVKKLIGGSMGRILGTITNKWMMLTAAIGGGLTVLGSLRSAGKFEQTTIAFETMLGSAEETKKVLGELTEFAALTPFEMPEIEAAARGLIQFGTRGKDLMDTLNMLGNAASGTSTQFGMVALIFNQIRGVGKLLTQDFRQLSTRGILSLQDVADHFKVTTAEAQKMMSKGKISFEDVKAIFKGLSGVGGRFHNLMEKQSKSLLGLWSTFQDAVGITLRTFGQVLAPAAKEVVKLLIGAVEWIRAMIAAVTEHERFKAVLVVIAQAYGNIREAVMSAGMQVVTSVRSILEWMGYVGEEGETIQDTVANLFLGMSEAVASFVLKASAWINVFVERWTEVWVMFKNTAHAALVFISEMSNKYFTKVLPAAINMYVRVGTELLVKLFTEVYPAAIEAGLTIGANMLLNFYTKFYPQLVGWGLSKLVDLWDEHGDMILQLMGVVGEGLAKILANVPKMAALLMAPGGTLLAEAFMQAMEDGIQNDIDNVLNSFDKGFVGGMPSFADLLDEENPKVQAAMDKLGSLWKNALVFTPETQGAIDGYVSSLWDMVTPSEKVMGIWNKVSNVFKDWQWDALLLQIPDPLAGWISDPAKVAKEAEAAGNIQGRAAGEMLIKAGTRVNIGDLGQKIQDAMFKAEKDAKKEALEAKKMKVAEESRDSLKTIAGQTKDLTAKAAP